jgi:hypothetical protein
MSLAIFYKDNLGNTSSSDGLNDFLLGASLPYYNGLETFKNKYIPYYIQHNSLNEWEIGLGIVIDSLGQDVLVRSSNPLYSSNTIVYASSNNNQAVVFSAGSKTVKSIISSERIVHGGNNFVLYNSNFTADTVQTTYGVLASGSSVSAQLPSSSGNKNLVLSFRILNGSNNNVVISPSGSQKIDGLSSITLTPAQKYTSLISDGSGWYQLNREVDVDSSGLPIGSVGNIQFKTSSTEFGGNDSLHWNDTNEVLYVGGTSSLTANIILPASSGQNTVFNSNAYNADFQVKGTGNNQLFFDASTGRLGINTSSPSTILHIVGKCANDTMRLESSTPCSTGVALTLYHSPSNGSEIGDYPATINLAGRNSNAQQVNYAQIKSRILGTDINATSGELIFSVDVSGVSISTLTTNPKKTLIGVGSQSTDNNNIVVGSLSKNSGVNNIILGHNSYSSGLNSTNNILCGHDTVYSGSNSLVASSSSTVIGSRCYILGYTNTVRSSDAAILGSEISSSGTFLSVNGFSNAASGSYLSVIGSNNSTTSSVSGIVCGFDNDISGNSGIVIGIDNIVEGSNNILYSINSTANGQNNRLIGANVDISGNNNLSLGLNNTINGNTNTILADNTVASGNSGIFIGRNLSVNIDNAVVIGVSEPDIVVSANGVTLNSGLRSSDINIFGSASSSGLFYRGNKLGINTVPSGHVLDVSGSIKGDSISVNALRVGVSSTSGSVLVSDTLGNAAWQPFDTLQENITEDLILNALVSYDGSQLVSTTGLYWNSSSGVLFTTNSNTIIPTGNSAFIINNNNSATNNVFNIRGSGQNSLLLVNAANNSVGINNASPTYSLDVSGTARFFSNSLYFVEKNNNQFIFAYDIGPASPNRLSITSSGVIIDQTIAGTIFPLHAYATSYPTPTSANVAKMVVWDTTDNKLKYSTTITAGFDAFNGSSDS